MSAGEAEPGKAKSAGIVSILIACIALINLVCGFIYMALGGTDGSGVWSGSGVSYQLDFVKLSIIITTYYVKIFSVQ